MAATARTFTIGTLAQAAAVNVETIRFYQRRGLLSAPARPVGGIRHYGEDDAARLRFIKSAQRLGFTLDEVGELLALEDGTNCTAARHVAERKLDSVRQRMADLVRIESELARLVDQCGSAGGSVRCPLIEALQRH